MITNGDIMKILEETARDWSKGRTIDEVGAVTDYLNCLCYSWMGGDWGIRPEHVMEEQGS